MTTTDILYYLLLGMVFGVYSALQGLVGQRSGRQSKRRGADGLETSLQAICRLERVDDLEQLLKRLARFYEIVVAAFADGDIDDCAGSMGAELRTELSTALAVRRQHGEVHDGRRITACRARIVAATLTGRTVSLEVAFSAVVQHPVEDERAGETLKPPVEAADLWTFERSTDRRHPDWLLVATEPVQ